MRHQAEQPCPSVREQPYSDDTVHIQLPREMVAEGRPIGAALRLVAPLEVTLFSTGNDLRRLGQSSVP